MHHGVAQRRQRLRRRPATYPAGVLSQRHVTYPVQAILDPPMATRQRQQTLRTRLLGRQAGDPVDRLLFGLARQLADAVDLEDLLNARPLQVVPQNRRGRQRALLPAAVSLVVTGVAGLLRLPA